MTFHWSLSDSKFLQIYCTLLNIQAYFNSAVVWIVSILLLISSSHSFFSRFLETGSPHMAAQKQDDQHERTFSSYVRIQVVVLKTCLGRWTIGRSGERGSGISVLPARYDDEWWFQRLQLQLLSLSSWFTAFSALWQGLGIIIINILLLACFSHLH